MDPNEKKKYIPMENVINAIIKRHISVCEEKVKVNNKILNFIDVLVAKMRKLDKLFDTMYQGIFYGGSYYDNLKVGDPVEYDLDLLLLLPKILEPSPILSNTEGYLNLQISNIEKIEEIEECPKYKGLKKLLVDKKIVSSKKTLAWIESLVNKALNECRKGGDNSFILNIDFDDSELDVYIKLVKAGPAFTLRAKTLINNEAITMDVDLVPCFKFFNDKWPAGNYRSNSSTSRESFFLVPKVPKDDGNQEIYWRLSFQEQEKELLKSNEFRAVKPAIKLLKKLRDQQQHKKIASYYIKTVVLWELSKQEKQLWQQPISLVFMKMLKSYWMYLKNGCIPYYWNENYNLIGHIKRETISDTACKIKNIIDDIENHLCDPYCIAKYLLTAEQAELLKSEVDLGKKHEAKININIGKCIPNQSNENTSNPTELVKALLNQDYMLLKTCSLQNFSNSKNNDSCEKYFQTIMDMLTEISGKLNSLETQNDILITKVDTLEKRVESLTLENIELTNRVEKYIASERMPLEDKFINTCDLYLNGEQLN